MAKSVVMNRHVSSFALVISVMSMIPQSAFAHVSEQGLVLLLPTEVYISAGVLAVVLTVLLLAILPATVGERLLSAIKIGRAPPGWVCGNRISSLLSLAILVALIVFGFLGSRDPLKNPLPLYVWTFWWIGLVVLQALVGNVWHWINPWAGICQLLGIRDETDAGRRLEKVGVWPALLLFFLFTMYALANPSPDDPDKLAVVVLAYWIFTFIAMAVFGRKSWERSGEFISVVMAFYARMAPFRASRTHFNIGLPSHRAFADSEEFVGVSMAVFVLVLLGCGSFDGINETFWWLSTIGVNPLEFPGRSAIIMETIAGILIANLLLILLFGVCIYFGIKLVESSNRHPESGDRKRVSKVQAFTELSISMLPIAFAYHLAHFLITFLVNMQYLFAATSDPMNNGSDLLGIGTFYVTTGFLNTHHSVEILWLLQAGIVVLGHILSVIMAHGIALRLFGSSRHAVLSQIPLAVFMIFYTFLGLWLLASPKGA